MGKTDTAKGKRGVGPRHEGLGRQRSTHGPCWWCGQVGLVVRLAVLMVSQPPRSPYVFEAASALHKWLQGARPAEQARPPLVTSMCVGGGGSDGEATLRFNVARIEMSQAWRLAREMKIDNKCSFFFQI